MDIEKFYKNKNKYEALELKALKDGKNAKCLFCKKPVGMKFTVGATTLFAECGAYGSTKGCDYKLEIDKEEYGQIDDAMLSKKNEIATLEENIVVLKFNHLFKFQNTAQTTGEFEMLKSRLETIKLEYAALLQQKKRPNDKLISDSKTELQRVINDMKNITKVSEIIEIQNTTIQRLASVISEESYKHKEVISSNDGLNHRLLTQTDTILSNEIKV